MTPEEQLANTLGEVKGLLQGIQDSIRLGNEATNRRIDDLRQSIDGRFNTHETRIGNLEGNERSTAVRAAGTGGIAGLAMTVLVEAVRAVIASGRHS